MGFASELFSNMEVLTKFRQEIENYFESKKEQDAAIKEIQLKVEKLEKRQPVNPIIISLIAQMRRTHIVKLLGGKEAPAYKDTKLAQTVFRTAAREFKNKFKIPRYDLLKQEDEEEAKEFWAKWKPNRSLQNRIDQANNK